MQRKVYCITRKQDRCPNSGLIEFEDFCRYLTRHEIEQAQTLPVGYTDILTYGQMQDVCGDGWTVDVVAHIFKGLNEPPVVQKKKRVILLRSKHMHITDDFKKFLKEAKGVNISFTSGKAFSVFKTFVQYQDIHTNEL